MERQHERMAAGAAVISCAAAFVVFSIAGAGSAVPVAAVIAATALIAAAWFLGRVPAALALIAYAVFAFTCGMQPILGGIQFAPAQIAYFSLLSLMPFSLALTSALSKRIYLPALLTAVPGLLLAGFYAVFEGGIFSAVDFMSPVFVTLFCLLFLLPLAALMHLWSGQKKQAG